MDAITKRSSIVLFLLWLIFQAWSLCVDAQDLHSQSASAALANQFKDPDLSYLLLDENGTIIAQRWPNAEQDIPVGSLLKPFQAVAYGQTHRVFPAFHCAGKKTCWLPRGHGTLHIREAIAFSCNSYFHQLVANGGHDFAAKMNGFVLHGSPAGQSQLHSDHSASPLALARAYLELAHDGNDQAVAQVLQGLALSAQKGTGKAAGEALKDMPALAKTGTAPCTHTRKAPGDGFAIVLAPADHPRAALLVRVHGRPGFVAAGIAGRMIAAVENGAPEK